MNDLPKIDVVTDEICAVLQKHDISICNVERIFNRAEVKYAHRQPRPKVLTMTILELADLFRDYGIPTSTDTLTAGIEQGLFPFAMCARRGGEGKRCFMIFERDARAWLADRAEDAAV